MILYIPFDIHVMIIVWRKGSYSFEYLLLSGIRQCDPTYAGTELFSSCQEVHMR